MTDSESGAVLNQIEAWCRTVSRPIAMLGVLGMLIVAGATIIDVLGRWLFNAPLPALNEVVSMVFGVAVTACIPSSVARGGQLRVDLTTRFMSQRTADFLTAMGSILLFLFLALLTWRVKLFADTMAAEGQYTTLLRWHIAPFIYTMGLLLGLGAAIQLVVLANQWRAWARAKPDPTAPVREGEMRVVGAAMVGLYVVLALLLAVGFYDFSLLADWARDHAVLAVVLGFFAVWGFLLGLAPLGAVMGLLGLVGTAVFVDMVPALSLFAQDPVEFATNSLVAVLPLFLMMGSFAAIAGLADDVYTLAHAVLGGFRGGLALATIGGCAGFGSVTGSSLATTATIGRVALPEMLQRGYSAQLATGCVAAGGTLGALIPPSGAIVVYALFTETSIGQLFIAALIPALIAVAFYLVAIGVTIRLSADAAPPAVREGRAEVMRALRRAIPVFGLFALVLGGLYTGVFTATESAAVGAFAAFLVALFRGRLGGGAFWNVMEDTVRVTALIYGLIFGALTFSFFMNVSSVPDAMTAFVGGLDLRPVLIIAILLVIYLALGCVMDSFAIMVITLPAVAPLVVNLGYDLVWWGIVMVIVIETGLITPPFGINMFVLKSVVTDVQLTTIFRGVVPFVISDFVKLALVVLFPALALWLPSTMFN